MRMDILAVQLQDADFGNCPMEAWISGRHEEVEKLPISI